MKKQNLFGELINRETLVFVNFYAEWCGPCKAMNPILDDLQIQIKDKAIILKLDVDNNRAIANKYEIQALPTFMLFRDGEVEWKESGMLSTHYLEQMINEKIQTTSKLEYND